MDARHHDVGDDDVADVVAEIVQGFVAVGHGDDLIALAEGHAHVLSQVAVVVDEEDGIAAFAVVRLTDDGLLVFGQWQDNGEGAALALLALPSQFTTDTVDKVAGDIQSQAIPFALGGVGGTVEGGEEFAAFGFGHTHARVGDIEIDMAASGLGPKGDGAARGRVFDGVGDEVLKDDVEDSLVGDE